MEGKRSLDVLHSHQDLSYEVPVSLHIQITTHWTWSLNSTHIRVALKSKQTNKLSKVPPAPSGLKGGRHKALYSVHLYQRDKATVSELYLIKKIYFEPSLVLS